MCSDYSRAVDGDADYWPSPDSDEEYPQDAGNIGDVLDINNLVEFPHLNPENPIAAEPLPQDNPWANPPAAIYEAPVVDELPAPVLMGDNNLYLLVN